MSIEKRFHVPFIAALALKEKQIQQHYRPIIAVHKWFARRPGTLFRGLALAEFGDASLEELFYQSNDLPDRCVADPFMGGGTPLIEANRVGCDVVGYDINPMAAWIVREELEHLDLPAYDAESHSLRDYLEKEVGALYRTDCPNFGDIDVPVKYFLWVKTLECTACQKRIDLFPNYRLAKDQRHPKHVLVCSVCGDLNEVNDPQDPGGCQACSSELKLEGPARRNRCNCPHCGYTNKYPRPETGPLQHRLFAIEYHNPERKAQHPGRFFKKPDKKDIGQVMAATHRWSEFAPEFVPEDEILPGDETDRLHRWGYRYYREMFNERQLLGLELSARRIVPIEDQRIRHALSTNLSDLLRYQNILCRYDVMALKSLDIFSIHGFPVGLIQCESNLLGITNGTGVNVGSGGWLNIIDKYRKAKAYCDAPFEFMRQGSRYVQVPVAGEWIGEEQNGYRKRRINIRCASSTESRLKPASLDAVFTDPPYFGNVQYGELMDFCYVWLRRLIGDKADGFDRPFSRSIEELTGNVTHARGLDHFTEGLATVYQRMTEALKPGAPLAFTFHHNKLEAYSAIGVAILDSGLICSASLPCPAEMRGSIHIRGTSSSIVDTIFVCRATGMKPRRWLFESLEGLAKIVDRDLALLRQAGMTPTQGDTRCIAFGHLTRMAIWNLRQEWDVDLETKVKLGRFYEMVTDIGEMEEILERIEDNTLPPELSGELFTQQSDSELLDAVSF